MKPYPGSFMLTSIIGFIVSAYLTKGNIIDPSFGFAFCLTFVIMFVVSVVSITPDKNELKLD